MEKMENMICVDIITCIGCPMGCELTVETNQSDKNYIAVSGHFCKIGENYAKEEITNPTRNIATSVKVTGGDIPMLSVKTAKPIPKNKIMDCAKAVQNITVTAPINVGDVILKNAANTGVDFIATRVICAVG
ncbi:MAG: DUF1667 domain-containing protein [Firmicutes bacterium]|nr:DUF1667 domain-containing protein [Bacillota bacterium]